MKRLQSTKTNNIIIKKIKQMITKIPSLVKEIRIIKFISFNPRRTKIVTTTPYYHSYSYIRRSGS